MWKLNLALITLFFCSPALAREEYVKLQQKLVVQRFILEFISGMSTSTTSNYTINSFVESCTTELVYSFRTIDPDNAEIVLDDKRKAFLLGSVVI